MQHILLATDGSKSASRATSVAANLSRAMGSRLSILTVGETLSEDVKQFARAETSPTRSKGFLIGCCGRQGLLPKGRAFRSFTPNQAGVIPPK
ncbi:MAG: universal stress protein [Mesorhizobium sp.]|uniref:universal stress protein n=1 Tax=Mesorhizobium sp. TaxID=1871066 RepID=UPI000FE97A34|nr:universal stress protein [Mesorhizobium sp.]RWB73034.1 MAG: universal stress protein [Mesorhizobium sp.]